MAKNGRKLLLISLLLTLTSCSIRPTYSYKEIEQAIVTICKEEFSLDVTPTAVGDTVWVYAPLELIDQEGKWRVDEKGKLDEELSRDMRRIFLTLERAFLNVDKPPKFYCFVSADTEREGIDWYEIAFIPDMIKFNMGLISIGELGERTLFFEYFDPRTKGDRKGNHLEKYDLSIEEFLSLLAEQNIQRAFSLSGQEDYFEFNDVSTEYKKGVLDVTFDIKIKEIKNALSSPLDEIEKILKKIMGIYASFTHIKTIKIHDTFYGATRTMKIGRKKFTAPLSGKKFVDALLKRRRAAFYILKGLTAQEGKDYERAREYYQKVTRLEPDNSYAYLYMGMVDIDQGEYKQGLKALDKTLAFSPDNATTIRANVYINKGNAYLNLLDYEKALAAYKKSLEIKPDIKGVHALMGLTHSYLSNYATAIHELKESLDEGPENADTYNAIADVYLIQKKYSLAITHYQKALDLDPEHAQTHYDLGRLNLEQANYDDAAKHYQKALEINPDLFWAHYDLGFIHYALTQYKESLDHYQKFLEKNPDKEAAYLTDVYVDMGLTYRGLEKSQEAISSFNKALEITPGFVRALMSLGDINLFSLKEYQTAITYYTKALKANPDAASAYMGIGLAYQHLKQPDKAKENLRKAKALFELQGNYDALSEVDTYLSTFPK